MPGVVASRIGRLPFFYGWVIVGIAFVTMAVAVSARTAYSLLLPPLIDEFHWDRGVVAGAFSFGFLVSACLSPLAGRAMDRFGPRVVIETGVVLLTGGLLLAPLIETPLHLYGTFGVLVGAGANLMTFTAQSLYLPHWFVRRRALAIGLAFSGVGAGAIVLLPWLQSLILTQGWRASCWALAFLVLFVLGPLNLLVWRRPQDVGQVADGMVKTPNGGGVVNRTNVVDAEWVAIEWTLARAIRTGRFWWIALAFWWGTFAWYAVQVHQTRYLIEVGADPVLAAWMLGAVGVVAIPGQIGLGALSDRVGREIVWAISCAGFALCYAALIAIEHTPSVALMWVMVLTQGCLGYALTSVMGPIVAEIFEGPQYGTIFGTLTIALIGGGAGGPFVAGVIYDETGSYRLAFAVALIGCVISAVAVWQAAPRKVREVPGRVRFR